MHCHEKTLLSRGSSVCILHFFKLRGYVDLRLLYALLDSVYTTSSLNTTKSFTVKRDSGTGTAYFYLLVSGAQYGSSAVGERRVYLNATRTTARFISSSDLRAVHLK